MIGRIYKIIHNQSDICYIGSTINQLKYRWQMHQTHYKCWLENNHSEVGVYPYFKEHGIKNFKMVLVKEYEVADKKHLYAIEQLWVNKFKRTSVNKNNPFRIETKQSYDKRYRNEHIEHKKELDKTYYQSNREALIAKTKAYVEKNKEAVKAFRYAKIICECGSTHTRCNKSQHIKSVKHTKWVESH